MLIKFLNAIKIHLYLFILMVCLTLSCDKDGIEKEFGRYSVGISYESNEVVELHFIMDGEQLGVMRPVLGVNPSYIEDCNKLADQDQLINVIGFDKITTGHHKLEIKTSGGNLLKTLMFEMLNGQCVVQDTKISLN